MNIELTILRKKIEDLREARASVSIASSTSRDGTFVRQAFDAVDRGVPVFNVKSLALRIDDSLSRERMVGTIATASGVVALLLAGVGLYGVLAYAVSRRTREIGLRMALGSSSASVVWLIAREVVTLVSAGAAVGSGLSLVAGRLLARHIVGVSPWDPTVLLASVGAMLLVATFAVSIPATRALRVDPLIALRAE